MRKRSQEEDWECGVRERDLGFLLEQEVEDLEQEDRWRQLGSIRLMQGNVRRSQDDCHAEFESERRLGDRDTSPAGLQVMPFSEGRRERDGHILDRRRWAGEWLRRLSVDIG